MAHRYSGTVRIDVSYFGGADGRHYDCSVYAIGEKPWHGGVGAAPAGFGPGVAYDSPAAYDSIARSALSFAADENTYIAEQADLCVDGTGWSIRRRK